MSDVRRDDLSSAPPSESRPDAAREDALASIRLGAALLEDRKLEDARVHLERAHELDPRNARAHNLLGLVYFKLGLLEAARFIYDALVKAHPHEVSLWVNLGLVLLRQGRLSEANGALREAIQLDPAHQRAHAYLGLVMYRRGDLQMAHEHFVAGGAEDFARKVRDRLSRVGHLLPTQSELLSAVASDGVEGIEDDTKSFREVDAVKDGRVVRDEEAWEALVMHSLERKRRGTDDLPDPLPPGSATDAFATGDAGPPPTTDPFRAEATPRILSAVEAPWQGDDRRTPVPAPAAWPSGLTGFDFATTSGIEPKPLDAPSLVPSGASDLPSVIVDGSLPSTNELPAEAAVVPPLPSVIGGRPASSTATSPSIPSAVLGFVAGPGARARLGLSGSAHLRASVLVAASGRLEIREALSTSGEDPICVLSGHAVLHLRVPRCAVALRDARDLFVMKSALVGFDDGFDWDHGVTKGLEVLSLGGRGSLLLDTRGPPMLLPVSPGHPVHAASDALLAWSREVDPSLLSRGDRTRLFQFRGQGYVLVAFPPDAHADLEGAAE